MYLPLLNTLLTYFYTHVSISVSKTACYYTRGSIIPSRTRYPTAKQILLSKRINMRTYYSHYRARRAFRAKRKNPTIITSINYFVPFDNKTFIRITTVVRRVYYIALTRALRSVRRRPSFVRPENGVRDV